MRRSDAQVHACLLALELPIRSTMWQIVAGSTIQEENEEVTEEDIEIQKFVERALFETMDTTWDNLLRQILSMCTFGYSVFEKVWKMDGDKIVYKSLEQRLARTIWKWNREEDGRYGVTQMLLMSDEMKPFNVDIPADKLLIFTFRREGNNMEGISVLRSSYKHWYIKDTLYKLDAVKHERQAVGIPVITLPATHSDQDEQEAEDILSNLRATEKSFVVLPSNEWKFEFAQMGGAKTVDTEKSIDHHNSQIVKNILAGFLDLGSKSGSGGSYALSEDQSSLFLLSLTAIAQQICDVFNREIIPELVDVNFNLAEGQGYPKLAFQKLGEVKYDELATSLSTLTSAGMLTPDADLEDHVRELYDLPKKMEDEESETMDDGDETGDLEDDATAEADAEATADTENDVNAPEPSEEDVSGDMAALDDEMKKLEASEMESLYEAYSYAESMDEALSFMTDIQKANISKGLVAYWDKKGRKAKPTIHGRNSGFKKSAADTKAKIDIATAEYKAKIDPLKKQIADLKAQKAAKKITNKQLKAKTKEIRSQIKAINGQKSEQVGLLKSIRRDSLQGAKQTAKTIETRKKAVSAVIKQITTDLKAKNATRSESIRALAAQIKANVAAYSALKDQAKSPAEKKNLKTIYAGIKSENASLRDAAKAIKSAKAADSAAVKAQKDTLKKTVTEMSEPDLATIQANGFMDADEVNDFIASRKFFDPSVIQRVQNYVQS